MAGVGLFAPLPLAIMIPFMTAQSAAMAQAFGTFYQYGKRKISAMTNEEFNKETPQHLFEELTADISGMIPNMKTSFADMNDLQNTIIREISAIIPQLPKEITAGLAQGTADAGGLAAVLTELLKFGNPATLLPQQTSSDTGSNLAYGSPGKSGSEYPESTEETLAVSNILHAINQIKEKTKLTPKEIFNKKLTQAIAKKSDATVHERQKQAEIIKTTTYDRKNISENLTRGNLRNRETTATAQQKANKARIEQNIKNLTARIALERANRDPIDRLVASGTYLHSTKAKVEQTRINTIIRDLKKKLTDQQTQLRNYR